MIEDAKWYLGGTASFSSSSNGLTSHLYTYERGTTVYSGRPTNWIGKVGLMYPSDYGYATSGGSTTNRESCLAKELFNWDSLEDCGSNDWLYYNIQGTIASSSTSSYGLVYGGLRGRITGYAASDRSAVRPVLYLSSMVKISDGIGTSSDPYILEI